MSAGAVRLGPGVTAVGLPGSSCSRPAGSSWTRERSVRPRAGPPAPHGSRWTWARITAVALAVPTSLVLFGSLGAGDPARGATAARIADADHVIKELPVVAVTRSAVEAQLTGRTPTPGVPVGVLLGAIVSVAAAGALAPAGGRRMARLDGRGGRPRTAPRLEGRGSVHRSGRQGGGRGGRGGPGRLTGPHPPYD
ncbi:hypothetical protein [Streptomyces sp. NPDC059008]|uniref:hypothetical protein n=1 Tax=Streptomyces sp. NPDC059008 TaxID=3346693 RepID=UPI0036AED99B